MTRWHAGRTVGRTLYTGDGPDDMVGVMVGPPEEARALAAEVVRKLNAFEGLLFACSMALGAMGKQPSMAGEAQVCRDALAAALSEEP